MVSLLIVLMFLCMNWLLIRLWVVNVGLSDVRNVLLLLIIVCFSCCISVLV